MSLTPKQEKFCEYIVSGMSAKDSYLKAYDTTCKDRTAINEARVLMMREDITARIEELRKPVQNHAQNIAVSEHERKRSVLWRIVDDPTSTNADRCRALDILNRMDQAYITITKTVEEEKAIDSLDVETLRRLAEAPQTVTEDTKSG